MIVKKPGMPGWYWQRITGGILAIGMIVHFWVQHFVNPGMVTFEIVSNRLAMPSWKIFDWILLICAIWHGYFGIWNIISDYNPKKITKYAWITILWIISIFGFIYGTWVIFSIKGTGG